MRNGASTHGIKSNPIAAYVTVPGGNQMQWNAKQTVGHVNAMPRRRFNCIWPDTEREWEREQEQVEEVRAGNGTAARNWTPLESNRNLKCTLGAFSFSAP